jgi:phage terminase small subunit
MAKKLDSREKLFVEEYLVDLNIERAAISAGYAKSTARTKAFNWVSNGKHRKPHVIEAIQKAFKKRSERTEITQDRVLEEFAKLAFSDPRKFFDENDNLKPITDLDDDTAACLSGMDIVTKKVGKGEDSETETVKKIKFIDKKRALDSVARHLGMFNDKLGVGGINPDGEITEIPIRFISPPKRDDGEEPPKQIPFEARLPPPAGQN